ncbi:molybdopterin-dependent oxidoreductase, partial [Klebsiella pneumoniae]|uniref:molybdopterin-dependent oxidoreductase n=1 Tax=Klebsiella pneumoniae TaxID=573 RepID=UPI003A8B0F8B
MVSAPASFSLDELKAIASQSQITMHTCMQGWTGIAKWEGVRLRDVLALVEKTDDARYVMVTSFGHVGHTYDGRPTEPYYECLDISMAMEDETILA